MSRYTREINGREADVYDILVAFNITCPAQAHAVKKLLMPGQRGAKSRRRDLMEVISSVQRALELDDD